MTKVRYSILFLLCLSFSACSLFEHKRQSGAVVEVCGQFLYENELAEVTRGLHWQDSAMAADAYIQEWATEILEADKGKTIADKEVEKLVEDYRTALYKYAYEKKVVQRMPQQVSDSAVEAFYAQHIDRFILKETIVKGILLTIPNGAPDKKKVVKWLQDPNEENIELLEKYAYRYASGYELFTDTWRTANELMVLLPLGDNDLNKLVRTKSQIELQDSISTYILQITDKRMVSDKMPIEFARPEIEAKILAGNQVAYLQSERDKLYKDAIKYKKIHFYEK